MIYQQGDILLRRIDSVPPRAKELRQHPIVLAEGEVTGHKHCILDEVRALVDGDAMFVIADKQFTVTHDEHKPITLEPGIWEVYHVREYDHFAEEARRVID